MILTLELVAIKKLVEFYIMGIYNDGFEAEHCTMYMKGNNMPSEEITSGEIKALRFF